MSRSAIQSRLPSQENLLLDYVRRLEKHKQGRRAVHIHLSGLLPANRREHHIRIAANTFESLVRKLQGQIFVLTNADLMFIFKESSVLGRSPARRRGVEPAGRLRDVVPLDRRLRQAIATGAEAGRRGA